MRNKIEKEYNAEQAAAKARDEHAKQDEIEARRIKELGDWKKEQ